MESHLLHTVNEDDPDRRAQFCEWFLAQVENDANFVSRVMWSLLLMGLPQERDVQQETGTEPKKRCTPEKLRFEIETASHAIPVATLRGVINKVRHRTQK
ncbi:hypothetical protein TNCV_2578681 [Trichonephila clavipes]|nr:hypothetical protein TNCV_2578681 [Trichonephila clavipes]